tara:strand:+ start:557 stop:1042 length:486 start_codon:yes stop_codon:yes gene_type:complete
MNIFFLNRDPKKAAVVQYNKHVVKMILESAQMLCTAHHHYAELNYPMVEVPYKKAHYNHPSTIWCRQNSYQYMWLYKHMLALGEEYTKRYNKTHLTITKCKEVLKQLPLGIPVGTFKEPPQCMPDEYKVEGDSVTAYWNYYENEKHSVKSASEQLITRGNG